MADTFFEFSVRKHLKEAWQILRKYPWYFLLISGVMTLLNIFFNDRNGTVLGILGFALVLLWSYISIASALAAVDGREELLEIKSLKKHLPHWKEFLIFAGVVIVSGIIIGAGFILLIIPGIYFTIKLMFSNFAAVDRKEGVVPSLRFSWHLIKGDLFWTSLLCFVVATALIILGVALAVIGFLVTYPLALIFLALLCRALLAHQHTAVVPQPEEIAPPQEPIEVPATETQPEQTA